VLAQHGKNYANLFRQFSLSNPSSRFLSYEWRTAGKDHTLGSSNSRLNTASRPADVCSSPAYSVCWMALNLVLPY